MIIIDDKIIILMNPKCGTSSLHKIFNNKKFNITFRSLKKIFQCPLKYNAPLYNHGNLRSVEYYCHFKKKDIKKYYIISLIRNPYKRYLSWYDYYQRKNDNKYTFNNFIFYEHIHRFNYDNYCRTEKHKVNKVIDIKNLETFWNSFIVTKFNVPLIKKIPKVNHGKDGYQKKYKFSNDLVRHINKFYSNDFQEGGYQKCKTAIEVNKLCGL